MIRMHQFIEALNPDSAGLDLQSLDLLTAFQSFNLLPDLNAEVGYNEAEALALFAFCRWNLSWDFTPATIARQLQTNGVSTWAPSATSSPHELQPVGVVELRGGAHYALEYQERQKSYPELVGWLADAFTDPDLAQRIESLEIDKTRFSAVALMTDGTRYSWTSPGGARKVTKVERLKIDNRPETTAGMAPFWVIASKISELIESNLPDEPSPTYELGALELEGTFYKLST